MNKSLVVFYFAILSGILITPEANGQTDSSVPDSIAIIKPKKNRELYQFTGKDAREIEFTRRQPKVLKYRDKKPLSNVGNGLLTLVTGVGFSSSREVVWQVDGTIRSNDSLPQWDISLYCEGSYTKDRERVRDSDGSVSVESDKTIFMSWNKDATGSILQGNDTIGIFMITMDPAADSLLKPWAGEIFLQPDVEIPGTQSYRNLLSVKSRADYGIIGTFCGQNFAFISNGAAFRTYIFLQNEFKCVFISDLDDEMIRKEDRRMPYLIMDGSIDYQERRALFRLAIMSRLLSQIFNQ